MTTIAINEKTAQGKLLLKMLEKFKGEPYFEILSEDTSAYNQEFVAKILKGDRDAYNTPQMLDKKQGMLRCKNAHLISHQ